MDWVTLLLTFFREAWIALVGALIAVVILALLSQLLRGTGAVAIGGSRQVGEVVSACAGILLLAGFALLGVPALVRGSQVAFSPQCESSALNTLALISTQLIGALVALRMLKAAFVSVAMVSLGGNLAISDALTEAAEAILGMALVGMAAPIASHFLAVSC